MKWNKCVCGKYHCPNCQNPLEDDLFCSMCGCLWTGDEIIEPLNFDVEDLYEV